MKDDEKEKKDQKERGDARRPYQPPRLTRVRIRLEESLLAGCKVEGGYGKPVPSGCQTCGGLGS